MRVVLMLIRGEADGKLSVSDCGIIASTVLPRRLAARRSLQALSLQLLSLLSDLGILGVELRLEPPYYHVLVRQRLPDSLGVTSEILQHFFEANHVN